MSINLLLTPGTNITKNDKIQTNGSKKTEKPEEKECPSIDQFHFIDPKFGFGGAGEVVTEVAGGTGDDDVRRALGESLVVQRNFNLSPVAGLVADVVAEGYDSIRLFGVVASLRSVHIHRRLRIAAHLLVIPISH